MRHDEIKLSDKDYKILADFRYALRRFLKFSENAASGVGLTAQQYQGLIAIRGFPNGNPMTIGDLAERLQLRTHSAVALVNRLVRKGLVVRTPAQKDKRQVFLNLTDAGAGILEKLAAAHREDLRRMKVQLRQMADYLHNRG